MSVTPLRAIVASVVLAGLSAAVSCSSSFSSRAKAAASRLPTAEFLLSSPDSTFWVSTTDGVIHVRGVPLVLAHYDRGFFELYSAENDQSYDDALLVGERLYRRDLITGDSTMLFADTAVSHVAAIYARTHPDERPLGPDEEGEANPRTSATAQLDILDVFGPFVSYEHHVDIQLPGRAPWHTTRRGVLDLRTGKERAPADLFGAAHGQEIAAAGRHAFESARDSAVRERDALSSGDKRALERLERRQFDSRCFALETVDGKLAVTFGIPGAGEGAAGNLVELEPITVDSVDGWHDASAGLAEHDSADNERWVGSGYTVLARYDTSEHVAHLFLSDSSHREWLLGTALGPLGRLDWLDHPPPTDAERAALRRAFDQAARYDENARVAMRASGPALLRSAALGGVTPGIRHARGGRSSMNGRPLPTRFRAARHMTRPCAS